jgi:hypothetical protein
MGAPFEGGQGLERGLAPHIPKREIQNFLETEEKKIYYQPELRTTGDQANIRNRYPQIQA